MSPMHFNEMDPEYVLRAVSHAVRNRGHVLSFREGHHVTKSR